MCCLAKLLEWKSEQTETSLSTGTSRGDLSTWKDNFVTIPSEIPNYQMRTQIDGDTILC